MPLHVAATLPSQELLPSMNPTTPSPASAHIHPFAIVTGASSGIGLELARCCGQDGHDLFIAADEPQIKEAAAQLRTLGVGVQALQADLSTAEDVDRLYAAAGGRPVDALLPNAGPA